MDFQSIMTAVQNISAMGILALMVYRSPSIIAAIQSLIKQNVDAVQETQRESLKVFGTENDKVLGLFSDRFKVIENTLLSSCNVTSQMVGEVRTLVTDVRSLANRVGVLEDATPK